MSFLAGLATGAEEPFQLCEEDGTRLARFAVHTAPQRRCKNNARHETTA
jgi:hypothetical protein